MFYVNWEMTFLTGENSHIRPSYHIACLIEGHWCGSKAQNILKM